jgi:hypothetical protein
MATILTSTQADSWRYPAQSKIDRSPTSGALVTVVRESGGNLAFWISTDNGASWSDLGIDIARSGLQEWSGVFVDRDGFLHLAYRVYESGQDRIYYRRAAVDGWSGELLVAAANAGAAGAVFGGLDLVAVRSSSSSPAWIIHIAAGTISGASHGVQLFAARAALVPSFPFWWLSMWQITAATNVYAGTRSWLATGAGKIVPTLDLRHNGDGHTGAAPDLWLAWGRDAVYVTRLAYSAGTSEVWSGGAATQIGSRPVVADYVPARWDGNRHLTAIHAGNQAQLIERDPSNIGSTVRTPPAHPAGTIRHIALSYDPSTGAARLYAVGTSSGVLYAVDYVRATDSWGAWASTGLTPAQIDNWGLRRGAHGNARYDVLAATGASPYTYQHLAQVIPYPPSTPALTAPTVAHVGDALVLAWTFADPDPADTQSSYALQRQVNAGPAQWWRASDGTWQASEVLNPSGTPSVSLPGPWGTAGDVHTFRVKVADSTALQSGYSPAATVVASSRVNPVITAPVGIVTQNNTTVVWTVAEQTQFRVQLANAGGATLYDSGWRAGTTPSWAIPYVLLDGTTYKVRVTTRNAAGLDSLTVESTIVIDYVEPPVPTVTVTPHNDLGLIRVEINNPVPVGDQPHVAYQEIYRRRVGETGPGIRIARDLPGSG